MCGHLGLRPRKAVNRHFLYDSASGQQGMGHVFRFIVLTSLDPTAFICNVRKWIFSLAQMGGTGSGSSTQLGHFWQRELPL